MPNFWAEAEAWSELCARHETSDRISSYITTAAPDSATRRPLAVLPKLPRCFNIKIDIMIDARTTNLQGQIVEVPGLNYRGRGGSLP